jgi:hypothetical protein
MSRRALFFALAALLVLSMGAFLIVGPGWCDRSPAGAGLPTVRADSTEGGESAPTAISARAHTLTGDFGRVPVYFVPNQGQADDRVSFYVQGDDKTVYFAPDGLTITMNHQGPRNPQESERWAVKLDFLGAKEGVKPEGLEKTGAVISYFRGKPEEWKTGLSAYSRIIYRELWPGIDLAYKGELDQLKYEFIVRPRADPSLIKLAYRGVEDVSLTEDGRLSVKTPAGTFKDDVPLAYQQEDEGPRIVIPTAYTVEPAMTLPEGREFVYAFEVGDYDRNRILVIDPAVLVYCGYIGGLNEDGSKSIAADNQGNAYVTGYTYSDETSFPATVGPDLTFNGGMNSYVAKIDALGNFIYCGYIAAAGGGDFCAIAVDDSGCAYVTQSTNLTEAAFPVTVGPDLTHNGALDAFVAKVNPAGTALVYCGYIGGAGDDVVLGVAIDEVGNAYVAGYTQSTETTFPVKVGPDLTSNGLQEAFVAKVNSAGTALDYCGYIGGSADDAGTGIAVDDSGNAYVVGMPGSAQGFPLTVGPDLTFNGGCEIFVAKVKASGIGLDYCGVIGGSADEAWPNIAADSSGNAYVYATTYSSQTSFPVKVGPDLTYNGDLDNFVAKVNSSGTGLIYCGYIGGSGWDNDGGIAVDNSGNAYITGITYSSEASFPVVGGPDLTYNGGQDAFVAKINASGTALAYCGYIGGANEERGHGISVDGSGNAYVSGFTASSQATFPTVGGPDLTYNGGGDAFVARVAPDEIPGPPITSLLPDSADAGDPGFLLSVIGSDFVDGAVVRWDGSARPTTFISSSELQADIATADLAAGKTVQVTVRNPNGGISNALAFTIDNPLPTLASLSTTQVTGGGAAFTLTVQGSNFVPNSVVRWNGSGRTTTYVSATELQAAITAADIAAGGQVQVTVFNPAPAGGASSAIALQVSSFALASTPTNVTVTAGQSATYTIQLTPQYGSFDSAVNFSCAGLPSKCTASFSPTSATPGASSVSTTLTLATQASSSSQGAALLTIGGFGPPITGFLAIAMILLLTNVIRRPVSWRLSRRWIAACALACMVIVIGSCSSGGGDNNPPPYTGTPKGTHTISVQATSGNMTVPTSITLVVN